MLGEAPLVLLERQLAHVAAVHPAELAGVEDRRRAPDPLDREALDQLLGREQRRVVLGPPAQGAPGSSGRPPAGSRRREAPGPRRRPRAWRACRRSASEAAAGARSAGASAPRAPQHEELLRRVGEVVVAPHHVGDPHVGVVDRHRQVVERGPVAASDHEVVLGAILEADRAADHVVHDGLPLVRHPQADRGALLLARLAAVAGAAVSLLPGSDVGRRRRVVVRVAALDELR